MNETIFYAWQSDVQDNRNLIESALKRAVKELNREDSLIVEPRIDKALSGAAGAPRIDFDVLTRIDACEIFVGDVTLVTAPDANGKPSPNPNVVFELGYAVKRLGWEKVILPFNEHFGDREKLPFDLDKHRLLLFAYDPNVEASKDSVRTAVTADFRSAIKAILGLPNLKDRIAAFFDGVNPLILQRVRIGQHNMSINIAHHRMPQLMELGKLKGVSEHVEWIGNGNIIMGIGNSNGGINDLVEGSMSGFNVRFNDGDW